LLSLVPPSGAPFMRRRRLAYTRVIKDHNIWRTESNGTSAGFTTPRRFLSSTRIDFNPQLSPDGRRIAFESTRSGSMEIWLANNDGSNATQLTNFGGPLTGAARWSPDGQQIVFNSRLGGQADLYVIGVNGGEPRRLTYEPSNEDLPSWSRNGRWVYFHSDRTGSGQVWRMPIEGGEPIQVTYSGGLAALESIDGRFVYYSKGKALGPASLWRVPKDVADGDEAQVLESLADWRTFHIVADGIYFIAHAQAETKSSIEFFGFTDGKRRKIAAIEKPVSVGLAVSNDGLIILYSQVDHEDNDVMLTEILR
jgi:Tol biopolymer transport system component